MVTFYVDAMLGKFGKILRILGFDTVIASPTLSDTEILNQCLSENRHLITNDRKFHERMKDKTNSNGSKAKSLLLDSTADQVDQLKVFFDFFQIDSSFIDLHNPESFLSRCTLCNGELKDISKEEAKKMVNNGTYQNQNKFWICLNCKNIFWIGSHWNNIKISLEKVFQNNKNENQ